MILPNDTLVAVADGATLKLFRNRGVEPHIDLVAVDDPKVAATNPRSGARHRNASANPDSHRSAEDGFAAASAGYLNRLAIAGELGPVFVMADPRTLGELRRNFHPRLQAKIVGELAKDLTDHSIHDISTALHNA
ncbi:host attachment protein [Aurantimonas sp. E1-2-R+4]|uniref:baeRF12 domain-containing protein n=1 Tax=Aurantimonas sp. E1-2-R+4 TaxID=3113714 RepID=UPI002F94611B